MTTLFDPPPTFELPLSKGGDLIADFIYKPLVVDENGDPVLVNGNKQYVVTDYPAGAAVKMQIDAPTPVDESATITGHHAVVVVDFALTQPLRAMSYRTKDQVASERVRTIPADGDLSASSVSSMTAVSVHFMYDAAPGRTSGARWNGSKRPGVV
jgi:hypothetical protein